ncbi:hypothetical protein ACJJTC_009414 [Scirpophaga incertulas]
MFFQGREHVVVTWGHVGTIGRVIDDFPAKFLEQVKGNVGCVRARVVVVKFHSFAQQSQAFVFYGTKKLFQGLTVPCCIDSGSPWHEIHQQYPVAIPKHAIRTWTLTRGVPPSLTAAQPRLSGRGSLTQQQSGSGGTKEHGGVARFRLARDPAKLQRWRPYFIVSPRILTAVINFDMSRHLPSCECYMKNW